MNANLYQFFHQGFESALDQPFLTDPTDPNGSASTYRQIDQRSAVFAGGLDSFGCSVGDRVVVQVEKSIDAVALYFACLRTGLVYVPINTAYTPSEVEFFLSDTEATLFVRDPDRQSSFDDIVSGMSGLAVATLGTAGDGTLVEHSLRSAPCDDIVHRNDLDLAAMLYTSGTTGRSKGAMLTHQGLRENGLALHQIWAFEPGDVLLHTLPIFHVHGLFVALHCAILNQSEVIFCPRFDPALVVAQLHRSSVLMGVPTHYVRLLDHPGFTAELCQHMRLFTSGSAPMTEQVFQAFQARTNHSICERYGMTECGIITSNPYVGERVAGTVGFALPGYELRIMTEHGIANPGESGLVQARGKQLFSGYWNLPDKTAEEMTQDGFFNTGDIGTMDKPGRLTLAGRSGDMIISGGLNVYPKEIETVLDGIEGIVESAVIGLPHNDFGEGVAAFIVLKSGANQAKTISKSKEICTENLGRFKHPKHYVVLDELPRNTMGKVQKAALRSDFADLFAPAQSQ